MESLKKRVEVLQVALGRFRESIDLLHQAKVLPYYESMRDSGIKRFEFCFDLFWKTLKDYLEEKHGVFLASPRSVVRECLKQKIVDDKQFAVINDMIDDRNNTLHQYDGAMAEQIANRLECYY